MNCSTIDIDQMLRRRGGKLLDEGPEGRVAQCPVGLILSDITSGKALCGCLSFLLLPEDAPLLLDDALVMFDDDRLRLALRLLQREAENRQILLFTCQHREQKALTTDL